MLTLPHKEAIFSPGYSPSPVFPTSSPGDLSVSHTSDSVRLGP